MRRRWLVFAVLTVLAAASSAQAGPFDSWRCNDSGQASVISSCTALIESGHEAPLRLAKDYYNRALALVASTKYDSAIADLNRTIALAPGNRGLLSNAYLERGIARGNKREPDQAIADYDEALKLNPRCACA